MTDLSFSIVVAVDNQGGIGKDNTLAWNISEDLKYFRNLTKDSVVIMGSKTYMSIPEKFRPLKNRYNLILTNNAELLQLGEKRDGKTTVKYTTWNSMKTLLTILHSSLPKRKIFICGGGQVYAKFMSDCALAPLIKNIYLTYVYSNFKCTTFFPKITEVFKLTEYSEKFRYCDTISGREVSVRFLTYCYNELYRYCHSAKQCPLSIEHSYHAIADKILEETQVRQDRTGVGILSTFGQRMEFDVSEFVPILTTKRVAFKACVEELLWFMRGSTNNAELQAKGVHIWDGNSTREYLDSVGLVHLEENDCGSIYGFQWRHFGAEYVNCHTNYEGQGYDQLGEVIKQIKTNPYSRRHIIQAWNPADLGKMGLPPCHMMIQFYVSTDTKGNKVLSGQMYQRSADWFLGVPFNILSYTILLYLIAMKCNLKPHKLIIIVGDAHIYQNHIAQVKEQISRSYLAKAKLWLNPNLRNKDWKDMKFNDFDLIGYLPHPKIEGEMAV